MIEPPENPDLAPVEAAEPFWKPWRIVYAIIAIVVILALLATILWPLIITLTEPTPTPTPTQALPRV
jgi:hypothetical protein